jgi:predicted metalloprotease with PDZ domain
MIPGMSSRVSRLLVLVALLVPASGLAAPAPAPAAIRYTLRFPDPQTHYVEVEAAVPTAGRPSLDLFMAVWTPGSYMLREYSSEVEAVTVSAAGRELPVAKTRKNRWHVETLGADPVVLRYRVYGASASVRYNWIERDFAMLNGAPTFLSLVEPGVHRPHEVALELPSGWAGAWTPLTRLEAGRTVFRADDYDTLVDSPIVCGSPVVREFEVDGRRHALVVSGDTRFFDADRASADVQKIVAAARALMGGLPYPHYHFFDMIGESSDGLEHANAFLVMSGRFATRTRTSYAAWLSLVAHEFFHAWNVKRLRPVQLGPFDYENENLVPTLWVAEGFTEYYADVLVRRAGLSTRDDYLASLSASVGAVQTTPGRLLTPVAQASYDAWIKQYRPNENTVNTTVDYYSKGAAVAFLLDAKIREATGGSKSLDDVMRLAMSRYSGARGYTPVQFYATASEVAGSDLSEWFRAVVESTAELRYDEALTYFGLRFRPAGSTPSAALGVETRAEGDRLVVAEVRRGATGAESGLSAGDELLALDEVRVTADSLATRLEQYRPGDGISVLYARKGRVATTRLTLDRAAGDSAWRLEPSPAATPAQRARLAAWIGQ